MIINYDKKLMKAEQEIESLREHTSNQDRIIADANNRIYKAIEYIEKADSETTDMYEMCESSKNDLLKILKGE